jgi:hypothetical protein
MTAMIMGLTVYHALFTPRPAAHLLIFQSMGIIMNAACRAEPGPPQRPFQSQSGLFMHKRNKQHPNALKHGAFAKTAIIPGEDPQEFEELHSALIKEWNPVGPTEEDTVLSIAKAVWRKRRLQKMIQATIAIDSIADPKHPAYDEAFALRFFYEVIEDTPDDSRLFDRLKDITAAHLRQKFPREKFQTSLEWVRVMQKEIISVLLPSVKRRLEPVPEMRLFEYLNSVSQNTFLREIEVDARIDVMIDRAVKRLVQAKAMKQMLSATSLNGASEQSKKLPKN